MCIAIVSENGVELPKKTVLKRCFTNNPDGAGYAVLLSTNEWECKKGFMTWKSFWKSFNKEKYTKDDTVLIHFRIGTSGKKTNNKNAHPDCTHPFPITDVVNDLFIHEFRTKNIVMHNGTCGHGKGDLSDTMVAVVECIEPMLQYIDDPKMLNIMHKCIGTSSRWFIARGINTWMLGDWEEDKETGLWYSNRGYLPPKPQETYTYQNYQNKWYNYTYAKDDPEIKYTQCSKLMYLNEQKKWDWNRWNKMNTPMLPAPKPKPEPIKDKNYEIYDEKGILTALIDSKGEIVWEVTEETDFDCPYCQNNINNSILSDLGECPFCNELIVMSAPTDDDDIECPHCGEQSYLIEDKHDKNDTECCSCGAVFNDKSGVITGWSFSKYPYGGMV